MGHKTGFNHRNPVELVARYIGTSYDTVKMVAANMQSVIVVADNIDLIAELNSNIDVIEIVSDNIDDVITVSENIDTMNEILANIDTITFVSDNMDTLLFIENEILNNDLLGRIDTLEVDVIDLQNEVIRLDNKIDSIPTFSPIDKAKLDGIEDGATADQTGAEIKALYEAEADTNAFTDLEKTKLQGIEDGAEANVGEEYTLTEKNKLAGIEDGAEANIGEEFTLVEKTKLSGIEDGATGDMTDLEIKTAYENNSDTNVFTDAEKTKLAGLAPQGGDIDSLQTLTGMPEGSVDLGTFTGTTISDNLTVKDALQEVEDVLEAGLSGSTNLSTSYTTDTVTVESDTGSDAIINNATTVLAGNMSASDKVKLDGIETGATADLTGSEIKALYEAEPDTNAFTDADKAKLANSGGTDLSIEYNTYNAVIESSTGSNATISVANQSDIGLMSASDKKKLDGLDVTNLGTQYFDSKITIISSTGYDTDIAAANATDIGLMTAADKNKLDGIQDLTAPEIKTLYESNADTNAFTNAEKDKLASISSDELDRPGTVRITTEDLSSKNYYDITNDTILHKDIEPAIYNDTVVITTVHSELTGPMLGNSHSPFALAEGVYADIKFADKKMYIYTDLENRTDEALFDTSAYVANIEPSDYFGSVNGDRFFIRDVDNKKVTMLTFDKNAGNATAIIASISAYTLDTSSLPSSSPYLTKNGAYFGLDWSNIVYQSFDNWTDETQVTYEDWSSYLNSGEHYVNRMITPNGFYFSQGFVVNPATGEAKEINDYTCNSNFACWHEDGYDYFSLLDTVARVDSNFNLEILPLNGFDTGRDRFVCVYSDADNYYWQTRYQQIREYVLNGVSQDLGVDMYMMSLSTSLQTAKRSQVMFRYNNKILSYDGAGSIKETGYVRIIPDTVTITGQQANGNELTYWMKGEFKDV